MIIDGVEVRDLLSFESLDIQFHTGLNVLVGQNGIGKSNLIRLVKLVRDFVAASPGASTASSYGFEQRYVRLGGPGMGHVGVRVSFTEEDERALLLLFVRAVAAQAADPPVQAHPRNQDEWLALYQRTAAFVESCIDLTAASSLFDGWLVMDLDARQPARWALAYEFVHERQTYHIGIQGHSIIPGSVARGHLDMDHTMWTSTRPSLAEKMDPNSSAWESFSFDELLPPTDQAAAWDIGPQQNGVNRPLTLQLARELGLAADYSTVPNFWWVLRAIVGRSVVTTENLRRPPQRFYSFEETESGLAVEDAGDLPLELYRRKNGLPYQRGLYAKLQERFRTLTGQRFDLYSSVGGSQGDGGGQLEVGLQVESRAGWLPIEQAGAGLWEALVTLSATVSEPGQVVFLDEAATHLHSSWQLQLLRLLRDQNQAVLVTHSPFLVPALSSEDFGRVTRLALSKGVVVAAGIEQDKVPAAWRERWRQIFAGSTDARDVLFCRGVILVEGPTEVGAFRQWFNNPVVVGGVNRGAEARNIAVISVDGDGNFGPWVSYLEQMRIPWTILADGPVLSPDHERPLIGQLAVDSATSRRPVQLLGEQPKSRDFTEWQAYWIANGVFTVATTFGLSAGGRILDGDPETSGEVERWFAQLDQGLWSMVNAAVTSKVRCGYRFAEELDLEKNSVATEMIRLLWRSLLARLDPDDGNAI